MSGDWWSSSWDASFRLIPGTNELAFYVFRIPNVFHDTHFDKCVSDWRNAQEFLSLCPENKIGPNNNICANDDYIDLLANSTENFVPTVLYLVS